MGDRKASSLCKVQRIGISHSYDLLVDAAGEIFEAMAEILWNKLAARILSFDETFES